MTDSPLQGTLRWQLRDWDGKDRGRGERPVTIPGVRMADFLRHATSNIRRPERKEGEELIPMRQFRKELSEKMDQLKIDPEFARRYVNDGFSGGEMKRADFDHHWFSALTSNA